ncbi:unnamed protein product [Mytilus coruscus]|uniref:Uncharacterized protein n=1 Tax=Mytilus coruscus TaxID=42192 RepID=A0A6J8C075_MYTCO|nr:unnamed protein product [Mytilus coruscus]
MADKGGFQSSSFFSAPLDILCRQAAVLDEVSLSSSASSVRNDDLKLPRVYKSVSRWTQLMLKEYFNIECVGDLYGEDVLQMGGISTELNPVQAEYLLDLEHILTFNEAPRFENIRSRSKHLKLILQEMLSNQSPDSEYYKNMRKQSGFNQLTSVWENLKGVDVTSKPDLRLFTDKRNGPALCVIEVIVNRKIIVKSVVKMDTDTQEEEDFHSPLLKRKKKSWNSNSSQNLSDSYVVKRLAQGRNSFTEQVKG